MSELFDEKNFEMPEGESAAETDDNPYLDLYLGKDAYDPDYREYAERDLEDIFAQREELKNDEDFQILEPEIAKFVAVAYENGDIYSTDLNTVFNYFKGQYSGLLKEKKLSDKQFSEMCEGFGTNSNEVAKSINQKHYAPGKRNKYVPSKEDKEFYDMCEAFGNNPVDVRHGLKSRKEW